MKFFDRIKEEQRNNEEVLQELVNLYAERDEINSRIAEYENELLKHYPLQDKKSMTIGFGANKLVVKERYSSPKFLHKDKLEELPKEIILKYFNISPKSSKDFPEEVEKFYSENIEPKKFTGYSIKYEEVK